MLKNSPGLFTSKGPEAKVQNSFRGGLYDILKFRTPLEADYDILKIQTFHFENWTLFEDLVTIFEDYFEGPDEILDVEILYISRRSAVGFLKEISKVWGFLERYETLKVLYEVPFTIFLKFLNKTFANISFILFLVGLRLLDEDFEDLWFFLGAIIFSHFDAFCWIEKVKSCLLELNQLEQYPNY
ncbi:hypothetical protein RclHR1_15970008 [Rhizophagus clarus]|uniref:Uncharacterized protein n=1 Tax=Rhizophagus clarus TaxID=94130 RepID=A0A2Z6QVL5_9GLOM|nr:hypothetical protein RclHR1_15970008 [Rhizophagus clarus]